jgi:DNA-binding MarR family transcriptional regulator
MSNSGTIVGLESALGYISETVDNEIPIQTLRAILFVAVRGSCTQKELEDGLGLTNASASRNISYWADIRFDKKPGKNFVTRVEDPADRRYRILTLTKTGRSFVDGLREAMGGKRNNG